jgi:hypothetical protein
VGVHKGAAEATAARAAQKTAVTATMATVGCFWEPRDETGGADYVPSLRESA